MSAGSVDKHRDEPIDGEDRVTNDDVRFTRRMRWVLAFFGMVATLLALSGVFNGGNDSHPNAAPSLTQRVVCGVLVAIGVAVVGRTATLSVTVGRSGVTIRNLCRTRFVAWAEIAAVDKPPAYGVTRNNGLRLRLRSGEVVSATAYGRGPLDGPELGSDVLSAIQSGLMTFRERGETGGHPGLSDSA